MAKLWPLLNHSKYFMKCILCIKFLSNQSNPSVKKEQLRTKTVLGEKM